MDLGHVGQRLYLFPEYYEKVPVSRLTPEKRPNSGEVLILFISSSISR